MWKYNNKVIDSIDDMPKDAFGFIYEVIHNPTGQKYLEIGRASCRERV